MKIANIIETALNILEKDKKAKKSTPNMEAIDTTVIPHFSIFGVCEICKLLVVVNCWFIGTTVVLKRDYIGGSYLYFYISVCYKNYILAILKGVFG